MANSSDDGSSRNRYSDLAIFTSTLYGKDNESKIRSNVALSTLQNISQLNLNCIVLDGGSDESFITQIPSSPSMIVEIKRDLTMGACRREALQSAINHFKEAKYFLWVEPEKDELITAENLELMLAPMRDGRAQIVIPAREDTDSYPKEQVEIEKKANTLTSKLLSKFINNEIYDFWFGPKLFDKVVTEYFLNYRSTMDKWDTIIVPFVIAINNGLKTVSVPVDYIYNQKQREYEENNQQITIKRLSQSKMILEEILKNI